MAEEEIHLREATRVAGRATLFAAVLKANIFFLLNMTRKLKEEENVKGREDVGEKSRPLFYPGSR